MWRWSLLEQCSVESFTRAFAPSRELAGIGNPGSLDAFPVMAGITDPRLQHIMRERGEDVIVGNFAARH